MTTSEIAAKLGISIEQVLEVLKSESEAKGTLTTTVRRIVTDADGKRYWA